MNRDDNNPFPQQHNDEMFGDSSTFDSIDSKQKDKRKRWRNFRKVIVVAAVFGLLAGGIQVGSNYISSRPRKLTQTSDALEHAPSDTIASETVQHSGVSEIVANVKPAIVAITSTSEEVYYDFFGRPTVQEVAGAGSGIIIGQNEEELLIVTNNHVIDGTKNIVIQFIDETTATGSVKGAEASSDLAVVTVKMNDLSDTTLQAIKIATLGNSDQVQQGELVVAIGNALGYGQSTTVGYVSALDREVNVEQATLNLLQIDAAINPGNSGGALLNAKGEVIGINSVKYVQTEVEGVGYAIPISSAIPIINDLMNRRDLSDREKGYLGIGGNDVTKADAEMLKIPIGVYINKVDPGSPADEAGLRIGDVIVGVSGRKIETSEDLKNFLNYTKAGTKVTFKVSSNVDGTYTEKTVEVKLGNRK